MSVKLKRGQRETSSGVARIWCEGGGTRRSSGAFWVAISYRLAACFTGIGSTRGVEIYWRSFRHFVNYNYSPRKTVGKNGPKIDKNCVKMALFLYIFRICSLKIFAGGGSGARAQVPHSWRRQC